MPFSKPLPKFNHYSYDVEISSRNTLLRPQSEALQNLQQFFQRNVVGRIALVSMPTGSGKSGVMSCLPYFLGMLGLNPPRVEGASPYGKPTHEFDKPVLVVAPDLAISKQLEERLTVSPDAPGENFLIKTNIIPKEYNYALPNGVRIQETAHLDNDEWLKTFDIIITNVHKFLEENSLPDDFFKLVIVDEAHHHPASMWRRIVQKCKDHAMVVFFTATPFRGDQKEVLTQDEGEVVYHLSLDRARNERIIRRINWIPPLDTNHTDPDNIFPLILEKVKSIQEEKDRNNPLPNGVGHMAIAITYNTDQANQVAKLWNDHYGVPGSAIAYHSNLKPEAYKKACLQKIRRNEVKLVVVVQMLLEGFDHPPISIAAIMTKISSPVKFAQFIGRAQRVVRRPSLESKDIEGDVVTHSYFQQEENCKAYEDELLNDPDE